MFVIRSSSELQWRFGSSCRKQEPVCWTRHWPVWENRSQRASSGVRVCVTTEIWKEKQRKCWNYQPVMTGNKPTRGQMEVERQQIRREVHFFLQFLARNSEIFAIFVWLTNRESVSLHSVMNTRLLTQVSSSFRGNIEGWHHKSVVGENIWASAPFAFITTFQWDQLDGQSFSLRLSAQQAKGGGGGLVAWTKSRWSKTLWVSLCYLLALNSHTSSSFIRIYQTVLWMKNRICTRGSPKVQIKAVTINFTTWGQQNKL